eukprot:GILJ01006003.1.p1 GENE.GILJ01006003.1~~GILJ01006003.1.p1  ORF type:complete len:558 (+),score=58.15 GILJ01006003.1:243-1676(+)
MDATSSKECMLEKREARAQGTLNATMVTVCRTIRGTLLGQWQVGSKQVRVTLTSEGSVVGTVADGQSESESPCRGSGRGGGCVQIAAIEFPFHDIKSLSKCKALTLQDSCWVRLSCASNGVGGETWKIVLATRGLGGGAGCSSCKGPEAYSIPSSTALPADRPLNLATLLIKAVTDENLNLLQRVVQGLESLPQPISAEQRAKAQELGPLIHRAQKSSTRSSEAFKRHALVAQALELLNTYYKTAVTVEAAAVAVDVISIAKGLCKAIIDEELSEVQSALSDLQRVDASTLSVEQKEQLATHSLKTQKLIAHASPAFQQHADVNSALTLLQTLAQATRSTSSLPHSTQTTLSPSSLNQGPFYATNPSVHAYSKLDGRRSAANLGSIRNTQDLAVAVRTAHEDQSQYLSLALNVVEQFARCQTKTQGVIDEVLALSAAGHEEIWQQLMDKFIQQIQTNVLLVLKLISINCFSFNRFIS